MGFYKPFAIIFSLALLEVGVFSVYHYFQSLSSLALVNPSYAALLTEQVLSAFLISGTITVFLLALVVYLALTVKSRAHQIAFTLTKDIALSREQFQRFYEMSPVPYFLIDRSGEIKKPNIASLRLLGKTEEVLRGKSIFTFLQEEQGKEKTIPIQEKVHRGVSVEHVEMRIQNAQGELRWVLVSAEMLGKRGGEESTLVTIVDIHEQKELERIKTEFLSLASHQLRTPLANLKWYIDFLLTRKKTELTPEVEKYLTKMNRRNEDMIDLVNTLLNLSRIEMGKVKVEKTSANIAEVVSGVVEELEAIAQEKGIVVHTELPAEPRVVETDARLVRIIVQNLLANALRYTKTGGTATICLLEDARELTLAVSDTGVGIPPEEQGKIFSKMYRASNAQQMEVNGNGIGLYMCKALAEALGGDISFVSEVEKGTTFTLVVPIY